MAPLPILVTGGAGFVGSHCCKSLAGAGYLPIVYVDLSSGHRDAVKWGPLEVGQIGDEARLTEVVRRHQVRAVLHFAGVTEVASSVRQPGRFYEINVGGALTLLRAMRSVGVRHIVFSSSAAVYGEPSVTPIPETHALRPVNPYGRSKLMVEEIVRDVAAAEDLTFS